MSHNFEKELTALVEQYKATGETPEITGEFKNECFTNLAGIRYLASAQAGKLKLPTDHPKGFDILKAGDILEKAMLNGPFVYVQIRLDAEGNKTGYALILHYGLEETGNPDSPIRSQQFALRF